MGNFFNELQTVFGTRSASPCLVTSDATLRYADLDDRVARFATVLARQGAGPGTTLLALTHKSADAIILYLACLRCGCVYLPVNPKYTAPEVAAIAQDAAPELLVRDPGLAAAGAAVAAARPAIGELTLDVEGGGSLARAAERVRHPAAPAARDPDDIAALLCTPRARPDIRKVSP
jgi:malonyl-CoA/methylmalonyl-CoA synthetase